MKILSFFTHPLSSVEHKRRYFKKSQFFFFFFCPYYGSQWSTVFEISSVVIQSLSLLWNSLPCGLGALPKLKFLALEGNPLRTIRRDLLTVSVQHITALNKFPSSFVLINLRYITGKVWNASESVTVSSLQKGTGELLKYLRSRIQGMSNINSMI